MVFRQTFSKLISEWLEGYLAALRNMKPFPRGQSMKISVIIPVVHGADDIQRSFDYICKQKTKIAEYEVIIANSCQDQNAIFALEAIENRFSDFVALVHMPSEFSKTEVLNAGMQYCSGDYVMFLCPGDAINNKLFGAVEDIIDQDCPDIISFSCTYAHNKFDMFEDDPLEADGFSVMDISEKKNREHYLANGKIDESYFCHIYKKSLLEEGGATFLDNVFDEDVVFVYPLLFKANVVAYTNDHGYCSYRKNSFSKTGDRIAGIMQAQTRLFEKLVTEDGIYSEYKDIIDAHFARKYYIEPLKLVRATDKNDTLSLSVFEVMRYVTLKLVPKWIENDYIFSVSDDEMGMLKLLNKKIESEAELNDTLKKDCLVTVITTTYNRCEKIRESIECILLQSWRNFEYIIVDDGSTDKTEDVVKEFRDSRIKYIKNVKNCGLCHSRNVAINNSTGRFIVCQDDDDFCRLDKIEKEMNCMLSLPDEYGMTYCESINHRRRIEGNIDSPAIVIPDRGKSDIKKSGFIFPALLPGNFITATAALFKRDCIEVVGKYDENLFGYEDWDLYLRISKCYKVAFIKDPMYDYYQRQGTLISNRDPEHRSKILKSLYDIDMKFVEDRKEYGIETSFKVVE